MSRLILKWFVWVYADITVVINSNRKKVVLREGVSCVSVDHPDRTLNWSETVGAGVNSSLRLGPGPTVRGETYSVLY